MTLRVNIDGLTAVGAAVSSHAEDLAAAVAGAADCIAAALPGWQGHSADALTSAAASWSRASQVLLTRLSEHAQGLQTSAAEFALQDQRGAQALGATG